MAVGVAPCSAGQHVVGAQHVEHSASAREVQNAAELREQEARQRSWEVLKQARDFGADAGLQLRNALCASFEETRKQDARTAALDVSQLLTEKSGSQVDTFACLCEHELLAFKLGSSQAAAAAAAAASPDASSAASEAAALPAAANTLERLLELQAACTNTPGELAARANTAGQQLIELQACGGRPVSRALVSKIVCTVDALLTDALEARALCDAYEERLAAAAAAAEDRRVTAAQLFQRLKESHTERLRAQQLRMARAAREHESCVARLEQRVQQLTGQNRELAADNDVLKKRLAEDSHVAQRLEQVCADVGGHEQRAQALAKQLAAEHQRGSTQLAETQAQALESVEQRLQGVLKELAEQRTQGTAAQEQQEARMDELKASQQAQLCKQEAALAAARDAAAAAAAEHEAHVAQLQAQHQTQLDALSVKLADTQHTESAALQRVMEGLAEEVRAACLATEAAAQAVAEAPAGGAGGAGGPEDAVVHLQEQLRGELEPLKPLLERIAQLAEGLAAAQALQECGGGGGSQAAAHPQRRLPAGAAAPASQPLAPSATTSAQVLLSPGGGPGAVAKAYSQVARLAQDLIGHDSADEGAGGRHGRDSPSAPPTDTQEHNLSELHAAETEFVAGCAGVDGRSWLRAVPEGEEAAAGFGSGSHARSPPTGRNEGPGRSMHNSASATPGGRSRSRREAPTAADGGGQEAGRPARKAETRTRHVAELRPAGEQTSGLRSGEQSDDEGGTRGSTYDGLENEDGDDESGGGGGRRQGRAVHPPADVVPRQPRWPRAAHRTARLGAGAPAAAQGEGAGRMAPGTRLGDDGAASEDGGAQGEGSDGGAQEVARRRRKRPPGETTRPVKRQAGTRARDKDDPGAEITAGGGRRAPGTGAAAAEAEPRNAQKSNGTEAAAAGKRARHADVPDAPGSTQKDSGVPEPSLPAVQPEGPAPRKSYGHAARMMIWEAGCAEASPGAQPPMRAHARTPTGPPRRPTLGVRLGSNCANRLRQAATTGAKAAAGGPTGGWDSERFGLVRNPGAAITSRVLEAARAGRKGGELSWAQRLAASVSERLPSAANHRRARTSTMSVPRLLADGGGAARPPTGPRHHQMR